MIDHEIEHDCLTAPSEAAPSQAPAAARRCGLDTELRFTDAYRRHRHAHPALREVSCLRAQFPDFFDEIRPADLFAGRVDHTLVGFSPDEWGQTAFGFYCLPDEIERRLDEGDFDEDYRRRVHEMVAFWTTESTSAKLRAAYPPEMARWLPSDDWMGDFGVAFPLYRMTGQTLDFGRLVSLGLPGLRREVGQRRLQAAEAHGDVALFDAMLLALDLFADVLRFYERQARDKAAATVGQQARQYEAVAATLVRLRQGPPRHLREALQLFWLYALTADCRNYGRMDVYMGDFLAADLADGVLTEDEALALLQSLWRLMADRNTVVHNRVVIGGRGRPNEANADRFALLAMEATRTVPAAEPQLSLRFHDGQAPALMAKALDVLAEGRTFPILYNDDVNIPAVEHAFGFGRDEAEQYVPYGCGEYILEHRSVGTPSGVVNLLKALEVTLRDGRCPATGRQLGLPLGRFEDFATFEDLWNAYTRQVEHFVDLMAAHEVLAYEVAGRETACLFTSMLYDDCLARGRAVFSGGVRYLGGTLETYGNANTADSLTAIRDLVYERRVLTPGELLAALDADFEAHARTRRLLAGAPKYGNDDPAADDMLVRVHEHVCRYVRSRAGRVGLHSYLVVVINNSANTLMGRQTAASADGRKAFTPMNNGNAPSSGADRNGVTAMLNSLVRPDPSIHAGAVQNMKFSRELFTAHRPELEALLGTYFAMGGAQAMITVVSRGDLERALREPEKYKDLFVRVGGFSARFVDLPPDVQREILDRTLY